MDGINATIHRTSTAIAKINGRKRRWRASLMLYEWARGSERERERKGKKANSEYWNERKAQISHGGVFEWLMLATPLSVAMVAGRSWRVICTLYMYIHPQCVWGSRSLAMRLLEAFMLLLRSRDQNNSWSRCEVRLAGLHQLGGRQSVQFISSRTDPWKMGQEVRFRFHR